MSCYFRHLQTVFKDAGVIVNSENKKEIDQAVHQFLGVPYKDCPTTWKALKPILMNGTHKAELIQKLKTLAL